jgi:surface polysaccharide O-acyltransferase-like enzyme
VGAVVAVLVSLRVVLLQCHRVHADRGADGYHRRGRLRRVLVSFLHGVIEDIAYGFLYFALGRLASERGWMHFVPSSWPAATMLAGLFVAAALGCNVAGVPERLALPAAFFGIAATLALCAGLEKTPSAKRLSHSLPLVGQCSMAIYVMHILLLGLVRTVLVRFFHVCEPIVLMPLAISIATLVPIVIQLVAVHLNFNELVGLPSSARVGKRLRPA